MKYNWIHGLREKFKKPLSVDDTVNIVVQNSLTNDLFHLLFFIAGTTETNQISIINFGSTAYTASLN